MAFDADIAELIRGDLAGREVSEQKMFGGLVFMLRGHMLCGLHPGGAMFRVGKDRTASALGVPGAQQMTMKTRAMPGMITLPAQDARDDVRRRALLALALATVEALPPKVAKPAKG